MNDGAQWKTIRQWLLRTWKMTGFDRRTIAVLFQNELHKVSSNYANGGTMQIKEVFAPVIMNVLWTLIAGKHLCENSRHVTLFIDVKFFA